MSVYSHRHARENNLKKACYLVAASLLILVSSAFLTRERGHYESPEDIAIADFSHGLVQNPLDWGADTVTVKVMVIADSDYREEHRQWRRDNLLAIERADDAFYRVFGINLVVAEFGEWTWPGDVDDPVGLIKEVERQAGWGTRKGELDILVAFTGHPNIWGYAAIAEQYTGSPEADTVVVIPQFDFGRGEKDRHVLQNEISHLFGAVDHTDPEDPAYWREDIMSYFWLYHTHKWSDESKEIIMKNRERFVHESFEKNFNFS